MPMHLCLPLLQPLHRQLQHPHQPRLAGQQERLLAAAWQLAPRLQSQLALLLLVLPLLLPLLLRQQPLPLPPPLQLPPREHLLHMLAAKPEDARALLDAHLQRQSLCPLQASQTAVLTV